MTISYNKLKEEIIPVVFENYSYFSAGGLDHCLVYEPQGMENTPARYSYPSMIVDVADIIMWEEIFESFKKPILFHEVVEFFLRNPSNGRFELGNLDKAHAIASQWDERFAKETLNDKNFSLFLDYKNSFSK